MSIEDALTRDIAAVTGGIVVTDSDLRDAREQVNQRIDNRRQRDRRVAVVAAAAAAVVLVGVAGWQGLRGDDARPTPAEPAPTPSELPATDQAFLAGEAPTPELLEGVWRRDNTRLLVSFTADGIIRFDDGGQLFSEAPAVHGSYEIDGQLIKVVVERGIAQCGGQEFAMHASLPEPGALRFVHTQPGTGNCAPEQNERWQLAQVLPTSEAMAGLQLPQGGHWNPPSSVYAIRGIWLPEGGGHLLELMSQGTYTVVGDTGDAVDRGQWSLEGSRLTLESADDSAICSQGDRFVLGDLGVRSLGGTPNLRGTVEQNGCSGAWAADGWVRLSP